ncbi:ABC transporter substrate-binding protein [Chloroflexi bacterium TSY]|nr:ABC transporter substrate-binding protein [Chloroflexi bacterium TSY]
MLIVMLAACGAPAADTSTSSETSAESGSDEGGEKVLIVAVDGDVDTFDPCCTVGTKTSQTAIQNTFDQLTQYALTEKQFDDGTPYMTVDTSNIVGMLAESWEQDGTEIIFTLREGLTFSDGTPIDAQAIVDGYTRIFEVGGVSTFLLGMAGVTSGDQFEVIDERTLKMTAEVANNLINLNNVMHNTSAVNPVEMAANGGDNGWGSEYFRQNLGIGSGPFVMTEYVPGDRMVLEARDDYHAGRAALDKVIVKIVPDAAQRVLLLKSGEVDMIMIPPIRDLADLEADPNINVVSVPTTQNRMLEMNVTMPPFDNKLVRKAVAYAVPYDTIIEEVWQGRARRLKSPIADGTPTSDYSFWEYETDLDKAAELLAEAGFPGGEGLPPIKLSVRIGTEEDERAAVFIQDSLSQIGMETEIEKIAFATFNETQQKRELHLWINEWISWVNDPFYHLSWIYRSTSPTVYTNLNNEEVDELIATYTLWDGDEEERNAASVRIQEIVVEEVPIVYIGAPNFNVAMRSNVTGYVYYNDELNRYYHMDKE